MGANPNRISSPFAAPENLCKPRRPPQSVQVSGVMPGKATEAAAVPHGPHGPSVGHHKPSYSPGRRAGRERIRRLLVTHPLYRKDNPR
jgi:hypothetical protein